ncbi:MAG: TetR family transcriptional regulator [Proteobacteria bacterium]|nr:TetR family transcriptional regulator [Pseudomonadota bacterium]
MDRQASLRAASAGNGAAALGNSTEQAKRSRMRPEERRADLVRAALQVAARKGLGRLVHADVARTASVSTPTAFFYFPDREALLKAVVREVDRYYRAMALNAHASSSPARRRIRDHVHKIVQSMDSDHDHALIWLEWVTLFRNEFGLWDSTLTFRISCQQLVHTIKICQDEGTVPRKVAASTSARQILAGAHVMMQMKPGASGPGCPR